MTASRVTKRAGGRFTYVLLILCVGAAIALAEPHRAAAAVQAPSASQSVSTGGNDTSSLEAAATKAGDTGRKVAMSLIALAFAVAAIVLTFKRDFKEAVGVFAIGIVAVLLVSPAGISVLRDTVTRLFGNG